jgi:hypothetical protein
VLERAFLLPGLQQEMPNIIAVSDNTITENGFQHLDLIKVGSEALKLISKLPINKEDSSASSTVTSTTTKPSHFLFEHKAYAISDINLPKLKLSTPITVSLQDQEYYLLASPELDLQLNGSVLTEPSVLKIGDCLTVNEHSTLEFIQVQ